MFVFWGMRWPHRRKERTVRVTGIASKNLCTISCEMPWLLQAESFQCGLWDTFSDTHSQSELWVDMYILQSMPEYTTVVWKPLSYTCLVIPSVHIGNTRSLYVIPYIFPCYLFIKSHNSGSVSEFLDLLYLLASFMFIFCLPFSPPLLLSLFFFELHSAYSRAYNLTPPSSLTLSLHPLAKLPFRSRGNPLISQTQLPRLHLGWGVGGWCGLKGRSLMGHKAFQMIVDFVFTNSPCFPSTLRMGSG